MVSSCLCDFSDPSIHVFVPYAPIYTVEGIVETWKVGEQDYGSKGKMLIVKYKDWSSNHWNSYKNQAFPGCL